MMTCRKGLGDEYDIEQERKELNVTVGINPCQSEPNKLVKSPTSHCQHVPQHQLLRHMG